jgi:DNA-binding NtrC family response regulator
MRSNTSCMAGTDSTVLVLGESGTGKGLVARAIHALGARRDAPFVTMSCAAVPPGTIESRLHEADGGTLFLDEVAELPLSVQGQLLHVLQTRRANVRLLASTHRDLARMVEDRSVRADLYFRLRVVDITLPPLRERGDDVEEIALALLEKIELRLGKARRRTLSREALAAIRAHAWPGNVRELENALERAVVLCDSEAVLPVHLGLGPSPAQRQDVSGGHEDLSLAAYFKRFVLTHQDHLNESELAAKLGISRKTLWERRLRYALPRSRSH